VAGVGECRDQDDAVAYVKGTKGSACGKWSDVLAHSLREGGSASPGTEGSSKMMPPLQDGVEETMHSKHVTEAPAGVHLSYGATGASVAHGRGRRGATRSAHRLSGVPEGDETEEGERKRQQVAGARALHSAVSPRMFFSLLAWAIMAPLLVLGPQLGKDATAARKWWGNRGVQAPNLTTIGPHLVQISQNGIAKLSAQQAHVPSASGISSAITDAVAKSGGEDLLRTLATIQQSDEAMMGGPLGPEHVRTQQTQQGTEIVKVGRRSIWNYGPFVFTLGVMVSILAKLLIAQPLAKVGTDLLLMWAGTQEPEQVSAEYYGYVYLERDEEFGGPSPRSTASQRTNASKGAAAVVSSTAASQAVTPRHSISEASSNRNSTDSSSNRNSTEKCSLSAKKKWPVSLDLPDHGVSSSLPLPAPRGAAPRASLNINGTPLPLLSPDSALTSPGETLMRDLDFSPMT